MNMLSQLSGIDSVLKSATGLLHEFKRPKLSGEHFAQVLEKQMENAPEQRILAQRELLVAKSDRMVERMDFDGNGKLSLEESGMRSELFKQLNQDQDGHLSAEELRAPMMKHLNQRAAVLGMETAR